ncbi:MAG: MTH938/NDUFAF3 family protein [Halanaerobiales bacterium]|nr:MTH938/NDUFAF3 family protein [Halanaerobiales bacterium]
MIIIYIISSYKFGEIKIDDNLYTNDLIIYPDKVKNNWWRRKGHSLYKDDINDILVYSPDFVVIGTGHRGRLTVDQTFKDYLYNNDIDYYIEKTDLAVKRHNEFIQAKKRCITALHLTC